MTWVTLLFRHARMTTARYRRRRLRSKGCWTHSVLAVLIALTLLHAGGAARAAPLRQSSADPLVFAFYYTWFDENTWTYDRLSDLPAEPYASRDRGVMARHIEQAQAAGIDAFLVAWYGPGGGNQTETNLAALLEEAAARGFRIGVLFETDSPFFGGAGDVTAALQHLNAVHAAHPAYLRVDGRPVVFFWRPTIYGVDTWRNIRSQSDPDYANVWISEGTDTGYLAVFDGHHLYSNTWNPPADLTATNQKFAARVAASAADFGASKLWVATVMPGYNDAKIRASGFARDRENGAYFARAWQAAIASRPSWIVINSFNEWPEGSYIEPSAAFGDQYLALAAEWSGTFKGTAGQYVRPAALPAPAPVAAATPTPRPEPDRPTAYVAVSLLNVRAGPGTGHAVVAQFAQDAALPITGRHDAWPDWWQVAHQAGTGWVYAPLVETAGPLEQVAALPDEALPNAGLPDAPATTDAASYTGLTRLLPDPEQRPLSPYLSP